MSSYEGRAIVYCEGAFRTTYGKTAHGLVRFTRRYQVLSVLDSTCTGADAGELLSGTPKGIPIVGDLAEAVESARSASTPATHFVIGLAPDGGVLDPETKNAIRRAIGLGLHVDSGLHEFISEDPELLALAERNSVMLRDVRKTPPRSLLHGFSGKIDEVICPRFALLGTDSAIGKRTTGWILADALTAAGHPTEMIGTGQTCWLQGARYSIILDSLINDFVAGELEHVVWRAWQEVSPDAMIIEGQGSLLNPAYPGGFEILAATRPAAVVLQHAPARSEYDGFPGYPLDPLEKQIRAVELISGKPVAAISINHEGIGREDIAAVGAAITEATGLPAVDPIWQSVTPIVAALKPYLGKHTPGKHGPS